MSPRAEAQGQPLGTPSSPAEPGLYRELEQEILLAEAESDVREGALEKPCGAQDHHQVQVPWEGGLQGNTHHTHPGDLAAAATAFSALKTQGIIPF